MKQILTLLLCVGFLFAVPANAQDANKVVSSIEPVVVNINTATADELASALKGVGLSRAKAIVKYRDTYGKFVAVDQLTEIKGIGEKTIEENRERIKLE